MDRAIGVMVAGVVIVLWWIGLLPFGLLGSPGQMRELGLEPGPLAAVDWGQIRDMLFWPVLGYGLALVMQGLVLWALPHAARLHGW